MKKYNIALLPVDRSEAFIALSQRFSMMDPIYHLSEKSLPHVTLCQFYQEDNEIEATWGEVCVALDNYALDLEFKNFSFITFDNTMFWISLMPVDISKLHKMQAEIASILKISSKRPYDPHLTLMSTLDSTYVSKATPLIEEYSPIVDKFILALGECDELGQFVNIKII
jgi:2'-5' RNA ligase